MVCDDKGEPASAILSYYDCTDLHEKEVAYRRWRQTYEEKVKDCISYYEFNLTDDICGRLEGQVATQMCIRDSSCSPPAAPPRAKRG